MTVKMGFCEISKVGNMKLAGFHWLSEIFSGTVDERE